MNGGPLQDGVVVGEVEMHGDGQAKSDDEVESKCPYGPSADGHPICPLLPYCWTKSMVMEVLKPNPHIIYLVPKFNFPSAIKPRGLIISYFVILQVLTHTAGYFVTL